MDPCTCMPEAFRCPPETITTLLISYASIQNTKLKYTSETEKIYADETDQESAWNTISQKHQSVTCCSCWFGASDPQKVQKKLMHSSGDPRCFLALWQNSASWKQKPLWKLRRCSVASHLLPWGFPCILGHLTIFNRPVFNEAIKALFIILGWKMAIEDHQFTAQALCLLLVFF